MTEEIRASGAAPDDSPGGSAPRPQVGMVSLFARDPRRLASFWSELMQLPVADGPSDDLVMLDLHHEVSPLTWIVERSDALGDGTAPFALDIGLQQDEGWDSVADHAEELGAERVARHEEDGVNWIEMRDPEGNRFRVFGARP